MPSFLAPFVVIATGLALVLVPPLSSRFKGATLVNAKTDLEAEIRDLTTRNHVMVFSKSYCPYCKRVKALLSQKNVDYNVMELDQVRDGPQYQSTLHKLTGFRTVPSVWIGGKSVGGHDDTFKLENSGELDRLLGVVA